MLAIYCMVTAHKAHNIVKYLIATLQLQLSEIFLTTNKYLILLEIL